MSDISPEATPFLTGRAKDLQSEFVSFQDIKPSLKSNYLIRTWLGSDRLSILFGPSNSGKSFVAIDMAMHVASGVAWRGNKVRGGPVVYVAAEGGGGIRNRLAAIQQVRGDLTASAGLYLLPTYLDLFGSNDATDLCASMPVQKAALIVIDTMARSMGNGDENSARDTSQFIGNCELIRKITGAHVMVIHHSGKSLDSGARGSSALKATVDTEIMIFDRQIICKKQRDLAYPSNLFFDLKQIVLGNDEEGDPVTSAVVTTSDAPVMKAKPLTGCDEVAFQALDEALRLGGAKRKGDMYPHNRNVVELSNWRDQCLLNGLTDPDATADAQRKAFTRAKERLLDLNRIRIWGSCVWKVFDDD